MTDRSFAHFQILRRLGQRPASEVYLAQDGELGRQVVLEVLSGDLAADPEAGDRFLRDARTAAGLHHPNLATVYKVGDHAGRPFVAMERVDGRSLSEILATGPVAAETAVDIAMQAARGMGAAHRLGVTLGGGVGPDDILVGASGRTRILTFGLASAPELEVGDDGAIPASRESSPDQPTVRIRRDPEAIAADVAAVGALLARMLGEAPEPLRRIIARTRPEADDAFPSAEALAAALQELMGPRVTTEIGIRRPRRRGRWLGAVAIALVAAVGLVALLSRQQAPSVDAERKLIVVLPFQNLGADDDDYFADGVTAEITARLAALDGLGVISRTSAARYRDTTKPVRVIAEELGVGYVIEGSIRWDDSTEPHRVRITPQLIRADDDTRLWGATYERELTEIFAVQSDIATRIVEALGLQLLEQERSRLDHRPTGNIEAYQAYLRGLPLLWAADYSRDSFALAIQMFERAIALDGDFALAHARLSAAYSRSYHYGFDRSEAHVQRARALVDRAFELSPDLAEAHLALGLFHYWVRRDYDAALVSLAAARDRGAPGSEVMQAMGFVKRRQGDLVGAAATLEQSLELNPLDPLTNVTIGETYGTLRRYPLAVRYLERAISLAPDQTYPYSELALTHLRWRGDVAAARAALAAMPVAVGTEACRVRFLVELFARDLPAALAALDECEAPVLQAGVFYLPVSLLRGMVHRLQGDTVRATEALAAAREHLARRLADDPDDHRLHAAMGLALAALGEHDAALRHGERAASLYPLQRDALEAPTLLIDLALIQTMVGEHEAALEQLDRLLCMPSLMSRAWLEADPRWDPLRDHPGYEELLKRHPPRDDV